MNAIKALHAELDKGEIVMASVAVSRQEFLSSTWPQLLDAKLLNLRVSLERHAREVFGETR